MESTARNMTPELQKTPLWQLHKDLGGKMVPFAGYDMPVQYDGMGVLKEHLHTRTAAGIVRRFAYGTGVPDRQCRRHRKNRAGRYQGPGEGRHALYRSC
jgi:hypothetical protein